MESSFDIRLYVHLFQIEGEGWQRGNIVKYGPAEVLLWVRNCDWVQEFGGEEGGLFPT
jgi:hypothetical protein